jgi:hypothetical protein
MKKDRDWHGDQENFAATDSRIVFTGVAGGGWKIGCTATAVIWLSNYRAHSGRA